MIKYLFPIIILLFININLFSDGIPVNHETKTIDAEFIKIVLSDAQVGEVCRTRNLTLSEQQHGLLKNSKIPNKIEILPIDYNDCTCSMRIYGIWYKINEVGILTNLAKNYSDKNELDYQESDNKSGYNYNITVFMDHNGNMYYNNKLITVDEINNLMASNLKKTTRDNVSLYIDMPPVHFINKKAKEKIIYNNSLLRIYAFGKDVYFSINKEYK